MRKESPTARCVGHPKNDAELKEWIDETERLKAEVLARRTPAEWKRRLAEQHGKPEPYTIPLVSTGEISLPDVENYENSVERKRKKRGK